MLSNFSLLAVIIIFLWLSAFAYYLYVSRQQRSLADELEELRQLMREVLDDEVNGSELGAP